MIVVGPKEQRVAISNRTRVIRLQIPNRHCVLGRKIEIRDRIVVIRRNAPQLCVVRTVIGLERNPRAECRHKLNMRIRRTWRNVGRECGTGAGAITRPYFASCLRRIADERNIVARRIWEGCDPAWVDAVFRERRSKPSIWRGVPQLHAVIVVRQIVGGIIQSMRWIACDDEQVIERRAPPGIRRYFYEGRWVTTLVNAAQRVYGIDAPQPDPLLTGMITRIFAVYRGEVQRVGKGDHVGRTHIPTIDVGRIAVV